MHLTCFHPVSCWRLREPNDFGKRPVIFKPPSSLAWEPMAVRCGQCSGCRLEYSRSWAIRCVHEAKSHENNCFLTLTFNDTAMKARGHASLDVSDWQLFMKRYRRRIPVRIKFYHCGEYGDENHRPHYHACVFGHDFEDKKRWKRSKSGEDLFRSAFLESLWPFGFSSVGALTFESAAYVARYIMKKQSGSLATNGRSSMGSAVLDYGTGKITARKQTYATMSDGIGEKRFERYHREWFRDDAVTHDGREMRIPRYYDFKMDALDPGLMEMVRVSRIDRAMAGWDGWHALPESDDRSERRLRDRDEVQTRKMRLLVRDLIERR